MGSQVSGNIINLSSTANVTSNSGNVVSPNASNPNVIINGNNGGSNSGGGTSANTVTVKFYYGDNYGTVKTKSVTKGKKLSQSAIPTLKRVTGMVFGILQKLQLKSAAVQHLTHRFQLLTKIIICMQVI